MCAFLNNLYLILAECRQWRSYAKNKIKEEEEEEAC